MRVILEVTDTDDLDLALRAAQNCISRDDPDSVMCFGEINTPEERSFYVRQTKSGWSSRRLYRTDEKTLSTENDG